MLSTTGQSQPTYSPLNGQPLGTIPQSSAEDVAEAFRRARRAQEAWARTSVDQRERLLNDLRQTIHKEPVLETQVDPALLGGLVVKVGDWVYDASVRTRLENLKKQLTGNTR